MKQLTWSVGKYVCLGKDEQENILAYIVLRFDGTMDGVIKEGDRGQRFDTIEAARAWCEAQL